MSPQHPFALALERAFPGVFKVDVLDEGEPGEGEAWAEIEAKARSPRGDPNADVLAALEMGQYSMGIGWLAHTHFDYSQLDEALAMARDLLEGRVGCMETLDDEGKPLSARLIELSEAQAGKLPALSGREVAFRARFFTGVGDMDGRR